MGKKNSMLSDYIMQCFMCLYIILGFCFWCWSGSWSWALVGSGGGWVPGWCPLGPAGAW
jgi:hypothetical protein